MPSEGKANAPQSGSFGFMAASTTPSLWRNGAVMMIRDADGGLSRSAGIELDQHTLAVADARQRAGADRLSCETNGFELHDAPLQTQVDFLDHAQVVQHYYPQCAELIASITGAKAFAFDHNVRSATGERDKRRITGGQTVQGPAHVVHGDYTLRSAAERVQQLAQPPEGNDTLRGYLPEGRSLIAPDDARRVLQDGGRFAIINLWRNIDQRPVASHPLALCDSQTVRPDDLVVFEIHYPNRIGENYWAKYSADLRMYYYPDVTREEAIIIKQWDSAGPLARSQGQRGDGSDPDAPCTFSFHSAFHPTEMTTGAPDRWSIEVRCMVIYP